MTMMKSVAGALAGLVFLVLAACASTGPDLAYKPWSASITDPGEIYSTWKWDSVIEAALVDAGRKDQIETIKAHYTEKGWPANLAKFQSRTDNPGIVKQYKTESIASFMNGKTPLVVLRVPADQNKDMPEGWRPAEDFYIVIKQSAVDKK
jgi:hypothetical protein